MSQTDRATDAIQEAVEEAIRAGMSPRDFVNAADDAWRSALDEDARIARRAFAAMLSTAALSGSPT